MRTVTAGPCDCCEPGSSGSSGGVTTPPCDTLASFTLPARLYAKVGSAVLCGGVTVGDVYPLDLYEAVQESAGVWRWTWLLAGWDACALPAYSYLLYHLRVDTVANFVTQHFHLSGDATTDRFVSGGRLTAEQCSTFLPDGNPGLYPRDHNATQFTDATGCCSAGGLFDLRLYEAAP